MTSKVATTCVFAFLVQMIAGKVCFSPSSRSDCASTAVADNGGPLLVNSVGPIVPSGLALSTDVGLAGDLEVTGTLPYLSAVAFEGQFATNGVTPVSYGCGDCVAITQAINSNQAVSSVNGCRG